MKQLTSAQIRQMWLDFWKSKGHAVEPSANFGLTQGLPL